MTRSRLGYTRAGRTGSSQLVRLAVAQLRKFIIAVTHNY